MEFQKLNNSVESFVTGSREGPPMIDRPFPPPIRLLIPHSTNPLLLVTDSFKAPLLCLISAGVRTAELKTRVEKEG